MIVKLVSAQIALMISLLLVSIHTSPLAHASAMARSLAQQHNCSDHVHQTADRNDAPQPKALLQSLSAIHFVENRRISGRGVVWTDVTPPFAAFSADVMNSRAMRPPIPPPTV
jgi:hypothetical protein